MPICVEIQIDDAGQVSVGVCPTEEDGEEKGYLKPAKDVSNALQIASNLLSGPAGQYQAEYQADQDMQAGFNKARGG